FYLIASWFPKLSIRSAFVGVWYDDTTRVGALLAVLGLPLAALGAAVVAAWLRRSLEYGYRWRTVMAITLVALLAGSHLYALRNEISYMRNVSFAFDERSQGLSPDEAELFERAADELDDADFVVGDPLT